MKPKVPKFSFLPVFVLLMCIWHNNAVAQARIVFGTTSDAYMVMSNTALTSPATSIYLVMGNTTSAAAANTITRGNFGRIISNSGGNIIKWYIGNNTGTYAIPWGYDNAAGSYIPFTMNIPAGSQGSAAAPVRFINFTTYRTVANNIASWPAEITSDFSTACACNASPYMVDRLWMIDNADYGGTGATPTGDLSFYYVDNGAATAEFLTAGNLLVAGDETNLQAESYNTAAARWTGSLYGTDNTVSNKVDGTGTIPASKLDKWWSLLEKNHALPVTWLSQSAGCNQGAINVKWSTSSEQNSDFFTVEKSIDGTNFTAIGNVIAAGNSSTVRNYSFVDSDPYSGVSYYRVRETDFNSSSIVSALMTVTGCSGDDIFVYGNEGGLSINVNATIDTRYNMELYDALGQRLTSEVINVTPGENHAKFTVPNIASAVYVVKVYNSSNAITKKIFIRSAYSQ